MTFTDVIGWFTAAHTMQLLLAMMIFLTIYILVKLSLNPHDNLNLSDLVTVNGRLDEKKFTRFGAWVISTWGFVYILVNKKLNIFIFTCSYNVNINSIIV